MSLSLLYVASICIRLVQGCCMDACKTYIADCQEYQTLGHTNSGVYHMNPMGTHTGYVYCYMATDVGGWLVFQRRIDGSVNFYRDWSEYENSFGDNKSHEYWLGDSFSGHNGYMFSTKDRDNDFYTGSCAQTFKGAWWYANCHNSNLNGQYLNGSHTSYADGINWFEWTGWTYSLKTTEMKIRRV